MCHCDVELYEMPACVFIARQQCSMLMRDIDIANLSVRLSVTFWYQMKTA